MPSFVPRPRPRPHAFALALAAFAAAALANAAPASAQTADRRALSGDAAVYNLVGTVRVVAGTGRDIVVDVVRRGRDAGRLRVEQGEVRGRQAVRVVYPHDDIVYPAMGRGRYRTHVREDGTFGDGGRDGVFGRGAIEVRESGRGTEAWADVTIAVPAGRSLAVHLMVGDATVANVEGDLTLDLGAASLTTERTRGSLTVDAGSGRIRVLGARGALNIDAGSGAIEVRDLDAKTFRVDGGSSQLTGTNVSAESIHLDLGSGATRLARVSTRDLRMDVGSGGVDVDLVDDVDAVRIDAGSGSVTLRIPPTLGADVEISTGSGGIAAEVPMQVTRRARDTLVGRIGDGRGRIEIDGGSGRIRLLKN